LRPLFDVVDYAQKNNTPGSLKKEDIARATGMKGLAASGYAPAPAANSPNIDRLNRRLDEPFIGEVSITGRKGIKENLDRYEKLIKNASR
jgi:hypothetical protein